MATSSDDQPRVTRIKAGGNTKQKKRLFQRAAKTEKDIESVKQELRDQKRNPLRAIIDYFKGSWQELRLVRWPDRAATWKMTVALIAFTLGFTGLIVIIDIGFQYLFNALLGK